MKLPDPVFADFINKIGRGKRAGKTLTQEEARIAMTRICNGYVSDMQLGAFLMLLRNREETVSELAGFVDALQLTNQPSLNDLNCDLDLPCYAGKRRHHPWFLLCVLCLVQMGYRIFIHGQRDLSGKRVWFQDILQELGVPVASTYHSASSMLDSFGFCYMDVGSVNPVLSELLGLREQFNLRSCANSLARMLNPSGAPVSVQGVFHHHVDVRHAEVGQTLGKHQVLCFRGDGGEVEVSPARDTQVFRYSEQSVEQLTIPKSIHHTVLKPRQIRTNDLSDVWQGRVTNHYADEAIISTLAVYLVGLTGASVSESLSNARINWHHRNRTWPLTALTRQTQSA